MFRVCCLATVGLVLVVLVAGCSAPTSDLPDLAPVSGTVTMGGKPLSKVAVQFESATGHGASGVTDETGRYELLFAGNVKGAPLGPSTVRITTVLDFPTPPDYKDPIPAKYNESSELKVTVQAGENKHDFDLSP